MRPTITFREVTIMVPGVTIEFRCSPAVSGDLMEQQDAFSEAVRPHVKAFVFLDLG